MPTINDLRQQAATIKNAIQVGENTATRVGTTFETIADLLEGMGGVTNLSTIDIGSIDTLNTTGDMLVGTPNIYTLTKTIGANTFKVGTLFQFANNGRYDVAQVIVSQFIVDADGRIDTTSADQEVHIFYRLCKTMNGGSLPTPIGTWTTWTELGGSGGSGVTIDPYPTQNSGNAVSSGGVFERLQDVAPKVDISAIDDIDEYSDMLATKSPFYVVTKTLSGNVFRIGTLMEFANQGRYILYQILATDYVLNDDGTLDTTLSENGGLKLIWRMKQFSGNPPEGMTIGVWTTWAKFGDSGYQPDNEDINLNASDQLQFANKSYDASSFSGLGRVYLRKNIVELNLTDKYFDGFVNNVLVQNVGTSSTPDEICFDTTRKMFVARVGLSWYLDWSSDEDYNPITGDVNWNYNGNFYRWNGKELAQWDKTINQLTQAMMNTANTIYHIQYDYDLGEDITMLAGCVLEFDGGSINGSDDNVLNLSGTTKIVGVGLNCYISNVIISNETQHLSSYLKDVSDSSKNTNVLQALADSTSPICIDKSITCDNQIYVQNLVLFGDNNATITFPNSDGFVWKGGISNKDNISSINVVSYGHCFNFDSTPRPTIYRARINNIKATSRNSNCFHAGSNVNSHCFEMAFANIYVIAPNGCGFTGFNSVGFVYENIASGYCGIATFLNCNGLWLSYNGCFYDDGTTNTATPTFYKVDNDTSNTNLICEFVNCNFEGFKEAIFDAKGFGTYTFINCVFDQLQVEYDGFPLKMMGDIRKIYFSNILIRWSPTSPSDKIFLGIVNYSTQQVISDTTIKVKSSNSNIVLTYGYEIGLKTALDDMFLERMPCVNSNYSFSARMLETSLIRPVWQDCDIDQTNGIIYPRDSNFISINNSVTSIGRIGNMSKRNQFVFIRNDSDHDITFTHRSWGQFIVTNTGQNIVLKSGEVMRGYIKNISAGSNRLYLWSPINDDNFPQNLC